MSHLVAKWFFFFLLSYAVSDNIDDHTDEASRELKHIKSKYVPAPSPVPVPAPIARREGMMYESVRHELSCPEGYMLMNGQCVMHEVMAADMVCPPGTTMLDGGCAERARPRRQCEEGFGLMGDRCTATEMVETQLMCEEGSLDEISGMCHIVGEGRLQCPQGYALGPDDVCTQAFPAVRSCPEGYVKGKHHDCTLEVKGEATPVCPTGSQLDESGRKCFSLKANKPRCSRGHKMSLDGTMCLRKIKKELAPCPAGFYEVSHYKALCERVLETPAQLSCPQGFTLNPVYGQCENEQPSSFECAPGFRPSRSQPHLCETTMEQLVSCPPGTAMIGYGRSARCQRSVDHDVIECCPPGFDFEDGRCQSVKLTAPSHGCRGDCERVHVYSPQPACADGGILVNGVCKHQVSSSCSPGCEMYNGASLRAAHDGEQAPACAPEMCTSEVTRMPELVCPEGGFVEGDRCVHRKSITPSLICKVGAMDPVSGHCVKKTVVPMKTECPQGTTRVGSRCVSYEDVPSSFTCPPDSFPIDGACVATSPALLAAAEVTRIAPLAMCPRGTLQNGMCFDIERLPRQYVCPPNAVPASKHMHDASTLVEPAELGKYCVVVQEFVATPPHKKFSKPKYYCTDGSLAKAGHCHGVKHASPIITCPAGAVLRNDLCVRSSPHFRAPGPLRSIHPVPVCPPGSSVQGTKCAVLRESRVVVSCPPGYEAYGGDCVRFANMVAVCPPGTRQTADGCLHVKKLSPKRVAVSSSCEMEVC